MAESTEKLVKIPRGEVSNILNFADTEYKSENTIILSKCRFDNQTIAKINKINVATKKSHEEGLLKTFPMA